MPIRVVAGRSQHRDRRGALDALRKRDENGEGSSPEAVATVGVGVADRAARNQRHLPEPNADEKREQGKERPGPPLEEVKRCPRDRS